MAKRGRKPKKKSAGLSFRHEEVKMFIGLLALIIGVSVLLAPFFDEVIFLRITELLGYSSIVWGSLIILLSLRAFLDNEYVDSNKVLAGAIIASLISSILLTFFVPTQTLNLALDYSDYGGSLGYSLHNTFADALGKFIEFLLLILLGMVSFSLLSNVTLKAMVDSILSILPNSKSDKSSGGKVKYEDNSVNVDGDVKAEVIKESEVLESKSRKSFLDRFKISRGSNNADQEIDESPININKDPLAFEDNSSNGEISDDITSEIEQISKDTNPEDEAASLGSELDKGSDPSIPQFPDWKYPPLSLLADPVFTPQDEELHKKNAGIIEETLESFGIESEVKKVSIGPTVVQYALGIRIGTKVSKIKNLESDIALALATADNNVRIEAPIPGTSLVGIEIPNPTPNFVYIKDMMNELRKADKKPELPLILGRNVAGKPIIKDLAKAPHLLVAGATGTGKSVGINSILSGLLMTKSPDELKLILVDPKMVELAPYNDIPHLLTPPITDMELVVNALQWAVEEMLRRYRMLKQLGAKKLAEYNERMGYNAMPYIVIVIDEMADLMLSTGNDVESKIQRLTQMARAVGIHMILATQRPSADVITGIIKANVPSRIAFSVSSGIDSKVIIDQTGAQSLIGNGDMLYKAPEMLKPLRVQGAFTSTNDSENVVTFLKEQAQGVTLYSDEVTSTKEEEGSESGASSNGSNDALFNEAIEVVFNAGKASASFLQRKLSIGYNRAARLIDEMEESGVIGPSEGSKPRKVLITSLSQATGEVREEEQYNSDDFE